jgi:hypothetical protein
MKKTLLVLTASLLAVAGCKEDKYPIDDLPPDATAPYFSAPFVSVSSTQLFIPFGDSLAGGGLNNSYEIHISDLNQKVIAAGAGYVNEVTQAGNGDYEIHISPKVYSIYDEVYLNVKNPTVVQGDSVDAGTILGKIGTGGMSALKVLKTEDNGITAICPGSLGNAGFNAAFTQSLAISDSLNGDSTLSPCLLITIPQ